MTDLLIAEIGGLTEEPPDEGVREPRGLIDALVTGEVLPAETDTANGGRPPSFPWGGHSNGVSSNR